MANVARTEMIEAGLVPTHPKQQSRLASVTADRSLRDSLAARWPMSGMLIVLAKSSISGNRTAKKRHRPAAFGDR